MMLKCVKRDIVFRGFIIEILHQLYTSKGYFSCGKQFSRLTIVWCFSLQRQRGSNKKKPQAALLKMNQFKCQDISSFVQLIWSFFLLKNSVSSVFLNIKSKSLDYHNNEKGFRQFFTCQQNTKFSGEYLIYSVDTNKHFHPTNNWKTRVHTCF